MNKKTLYQIDSQGKTRVWSIDVNQTTDGAEIVVEAGILGGKTVRTVTPITEGKNIGQSNETTPVEQAWKDAQSEIDKKTAKGYVADISQAKASSVLGSGVPAPMLAHKYDPSMKQSGSKDLKKLGLHGKQVVVSDKLDGNRCLAHVTPAGVKLWTRKGKPFLPIPHIHDQLHECFLKVYDYVNRTYGVNEYWIDGELFTQKHTFNRVNGVLKKATKDAADHAVIRDMGYHIYDVILPVGYSTRYKVIQYFQHDNLFLVEARTVIADEQTLQVALEDALSRGQEGLIIRQIDVPYEHTRTTQLLKYKVFEDDEFEVVGFKKSITGDTLGSFQFVMNDEQVRRSLRGASGDLPDRTFYAPFNGTDEEQQAIWDYRGLYLGKRMTVEYFGFSAPEEGGKPRFPKAKGVRAID